MKFRDLAPYSNRIAILIVWLFHLTALIGIVLGHQEWFMVKTPLNLIICALLFAWLYPMDSTRKFLAFALFFLGGMFAEWVGVNYGLLFGDYSYGSNFGPKIGGVPYLIGMYWALLTFITADICTFFTQPTWTRPVLAALLMVVLDFLMEHTAPIFDFWTFAGGRAGLENYGTWFILALLFQAVLHRLQLSQKRIFSLHLYLAQFVFFGFLYIYLR